MLPNTPEFIYSWFGLAKIGAAMVPINTSFKATEAQYVVNHSEAVGLVVNNGYLDVALQIRNNCPHLKWLACTEADPSKEGPEDIIPFEKLTAGMSRTLEKVDLKDDDLAAIIYTSGTTGFPKGAMHVHSSFPLTGEAFILCAGLKPDDRLMVILPFYHVNAEFYSTMGAIAAGASLVIIRRRGENISAREVETVINENPKVVEAAVIAVPSELGEDEVMACIALKPGINMTPEEVVLWCKERLARFKVPRYVQFRDRFPKTATQRTQKNVIKEEKDLLTKAHDMEAFKKSLKI